MMAKPIQNVGLGGIRKTAILILKNEVNEFGMPV